MQSGTCRNCSDHCEQCVGTFCKDCANMIKCDECRFYSCNSCHGPSCNYCGKGTCHHCIGMAPELVIRECRVCRETVCNQCREMVTCARCFSSHCLDCGDATKKCDTCSQVFCSECVSHLLQIGDGSVQVTYCDTCWPFSAHENTTSLVGDDVDERPTKRAKSG